MLLKVLKRREEILPSFSLYLAKVWPGPRMTRTGQLNKKENNT
nr:MAG TPA: hypothetical protein [Herelleviridae sp.]